MGKSLSEYETPEDAEIKRLRGALKEIADMGAKTNADANVKVIWEHQKIARAALKPNY